ncbi:Putative type II secretion system protein K [Halioglobus japonicus]|nr:Putative type II secretion system protein K [Halioglobus japonicus]
MHCLRSNSGAAINARRTQGGAALIVAMLVFALATALVVAMKGDFDRFFQRSVNLLFDEQAQAYLRGAEDLAAMVLIMDYDQDKSEGMTRDDLEELWAEEAPDYPLDDIGWMRGSIEDLQGRFNLNALAVRPRQADQSGATIAYTAAQEQFIRLLQALEEPIVSEQEARAITESVSDWLDTDTIPSANGVEDDYYYGQTPSYRAANRPMGSVSELRAVAYMTPEIYEALLPYVTVWPQTPEPINIHTASAMVLRTLNSDKNLSPLSAEEGQSLIEYREEVGFKDIPDFLANAAFEGRRETMTGVRDELGESSEYFLLDATAEVADRNVRLYSVLHRHNRQIETLVRASGSL